MTLEQLIAQFRADARDNVAPYFFSSDAVTGWLNEAEDEAAIRARLLFDDATVAVCAITVVADTHTYATHAAMLDITRAAFTPTGGEPLALHLVDRTEMERMDPDWRTSTGDPAYLVQDDTRVRMVPTPAVAGALVLECHRLPLVDMEDDDDAPEIAAAHHRHLVHWALHRAFSVPDSETIDPTRSASAEREFTRYFGIRPDAEKRRETSANQPHVNKPFFI